MVKNILIIIILCNVLALHAQTPLDRAEKFFVLNDIEVASKLYNDILEADKENTKALFGAAICFHLLNKLQRANSAFVKYYQGKPEPSQSDIYYIKNLMGLEMYAEAIAALDEYRKVDIEVAEQFIKSCEFAIKNKKSEIEYKESLLPLNSPDFDFYPVLFDKNLSFISVRDDKEVTRGPIMDFSKARIFRAEWGEKIHFSKPLNNNIPANLGLISYSPMDKKVAVTKHSFHTNQRIVGDNLLNMSIFIGKYENGNMINSLVAFPYNEPGVSNGMPSFSEDGKTIYFTSNRSGGFGGFDIYKTVYMNGKWSEPVNLGPEINSVGDEISPVIVDNYLYFASDYHAGFGGFDLFRVSSVAGEWVSRINMGRGINSSYDDYSIWYDEDDNFGYICSNRPGGKGNSDIYSIRKTIKKVNILVKDESSNKPLPGVMVDFSSCGEPVYASNQSGICSFKAKENFDCHLMVTKVGYTKSSLHIHYDKIEGVETHFNVFLKKISQFSGGRIKNAATNKPIGDAYIELKNTALDELQTAYSDIDGKFELYLEPNTTYEIKIEYPGFETEIKIFNSGINVPAESFDIFYLAEIGSKPFAASGVPMVQPKGMDYYASIDTIPLSKDAVSQSNRINLLLSRGYAIQLASVATDQINFEYFKSLSEFGRVYVVQERGLSKVRLGVYASQDEAKKVLIKVKSFSEFSDAFVIQQTEELMGFIEDPNHSVTKNNTSTVSNPGPTQTKSKESVKVAEKTDSPMKKSDPVADNVRKPQEGKADKVSNQNEEVSTKADKKIESTTVQETVTQVVPAEVNQILSKDVEVEYLIRLAAYLDIRYFDESKVQNLGEIRTFQSGDYTVMLIKGYNDIEKARKAQKVAIDAGFTNAQIVVYKGQQLLRIE